MEPNEVFHEQWKNGESAFEPESGTLYYGFQTHLPYNFFTSNPKTIAYKTEYVIKNLVLMTPIVVNSNYEYEEQCDRRHKLLISRNDGSLTFSKELIEKYGESKDGEA